MLQQTGFAYSGISANLDVAADFKRSMNFSDKLMSGQPRSTDSANDVVKRMARRLGQGSTGTGVASLTGKAKSLLPQLFDQIVALPVAAAGRNLQRKLDQGGPETPRPCPVVGMKSANRAFPSEFLGRGTRSSEVKNKNLKPAQQSKHGLVIAWRASITEIFPERMHESAHIVVGRARPLDASKKRLRVAKLPRPGQDSLVGAIDFP
jgi:hypothetical protein